MISKKHSPLVLLALTLSLLPANVLAQKGADDSGVKFYGVVKSLPSGGGLGSWNIDGRTVWVLAKTTLSGAPGAGSCVEVQGTPRVDNSVDASKISTEDRARCAAATTPPPLTPPTAEKPSFFGSVQALPASGLIGDWTVSSRVVHVTSSTHIRQERGPVTIGSCVEVKGAVGADNSIAAEDVEIESGSAGCPSAAENERLEVEFAGLIRAMPASGSVGAWTVAGRALRVTASTAVDARGVILAVGSCVEVKGNFASDGIVDATRIHADDSCAAATANAQSPSFVGTVQSLPSSGLVGDWMVSSRTVHVTVQTDIRADSRPVAVAACVEVSGPVQADNSIQATRIKTEDAERCGGSTPPPAGRFELEGIVESAPASGVIGEWKVNKRTVTVTSATVIDTEHARLAVGSCVEVHGTLQTSGAVVASSIETRSGSGTCLLRGGVVSAASFSGAAIAPGQIVSLFGLNIGPAAPMNLELADDRVSNRLGNVRVLFNGMPAPLVMVAPGQINAVVPFGIDDSKPAEVQVENNGVWSDTLKVPVGSAAPSVFTLSQDGRGRGAILNFDDSTGGYRVNDAANPIRRGGYIVVYATGAGRMEPSVDDGRVVSGSTLPRPVQKVELTIGGKVAEVQFAGAAPGMIAGALQINARIPDDAPQGDDIPIVLKVGDHRSQDSVTVAIR